MRILKNTIIVLFIAVTAGYALHYAIATIITMADIPSDTLAVHSVSNAYPVVFSTYLGGTENEGWSSSAFDGTGKIYIVGGSKSFDFPITENAVQSTNGGDFDLVLLKLSADGSDLIYSSYFGGIGRESACGIFIDKNNGLIIAGTTYSSDYPLTENAIEHRFNGSAMGFVSKFDSSGKLIFSTYIGGEEHDQLFGMAVDIEGNIFVTGLTESRQLPVTPGAMQSTFRGGSNDAFIIKIDSSGSNILYCTYFGGSGYDEAYTIKVNKKGEAIIAGATSSQNLPTTPGVVFGRAPWGGEDGFIVKISADGRRLVQSTYLGGVESWDYIESIDVDDDENIYALGYTISSNYPVTPGVIRPYLSNPGTKRGDWCGFVTKLSPNMDSLIFSTFLGGNNIEWPQNIYSYNNNVVVIGSTQSDDFPVTNDALQTSLKGTKDVFLTILNHDGTEIVYSTYYGGSGYEAARGSFSESDSSIVLGFTTNSIDFPTSPGALQRSYGGGVYDAAIVKFSLKDILVSTSPVPGVPSSLALGQAYPNPAISGALVTMPYSVAQRGAGSMSIYNTLGQQVAAYPISHNTPGNYSKTIVLPALQQGLYFYTLEYGGKRETRKMVVR